MHGERICERVKEMKGKGTVKKYGEIYFENCTCYNINVDEYSVFS